MIQFGGYFIDQQFDEIIIPSIWETTTWTSRDGSEIENQLWSFEDKGGRKVTLIPEVTAVIKDLYPSWKAIKKPIRVFYISRCYRYEKPQQGRYREFTQIGCEILGPNNDSYYNESKTVLKNILDNVNIEYIFNDDVIRGLTYYSRTGFEASCDCLGAQKQIAGGGEYKLSDTESGAGFAIGLDRLLLAKSIQSGILSK